MWVNFHALVKSANLYILMAVPSNGGGGVRGIILLYLNYLTTRPSPHILISIFPLLVRLMTQLLHFKKHIEPTTFKKKKYFSPPLHILMEQS